jgi:uncharacterized protein YjbI with pentapeptide repeats
MKPAHWAALIMLILSFTCCMWIVASTAANLLIPGSMPEDFRMRPEEMIIGAIICMIAPVTLAGASGLTWWFGVRRSTISHASQQTPTSPAQRPAGPPIEPDGREAGSAALEQYLQQLSQFWLTQGEAPPNTMRPRIQALTRQALIGLDLVGKQRVAACLQSLQLRMGETTAGLYGIELAGADLRYASLRAVNLAGARLQGSMLTGADLRGADLSDCDLEGADLRLACLDQARLERANLRKVRLQGASLRGAMLTHAELDQASFWQADLSGAFVTRSQLAAAASVEGATLPETLP